MSTWPELHAGTNFNYVWDVNTLAWIKEEPATASAGGDVTIIDGGASGEADVVEASANATWTGNRALVVAQREVESNNVAPQSTRFLTVGGYDNVADRAWRMPVWSNTAGTAPRSDLEPGVMVRNLNPFATTSGTLSALNATVALQMMRYNAATAFISVVNTASFIGTLTPRITDSASVAYDTFAYDAQTGERVTTLTLGRSYFVNVPATNTALVQATAYTSGTATIRIAVSPESSGILTAHINGVTPSQKAISYGSIAQGAAGTTTLVAADASKKVKLLSYQIVMDGAGTIKFSDGTTDLSGVMTLADDDHIDMMGDPNCPITETAAINRPLQIVTTGGTAQGHFSYFLEA